jgi:hypothetical protein
MGRKFTIEEDDFLRANYMTIPAKRMARMLGRTEGTARQRMKLLGITVPPEIVEQFRQASYIKKGNVPLNKGQKMPKEVYKKCKATMFKKGSVPPNRKPVGSERIDSKDGYVWIKVMEGLNSYRLKHRVLWEQHFGPIPKGTNVQFKDGDRLNIVIDNLELVSKDGNMLRNTFHNYPKEIASTIQLMGALTRQINKHKKKQNEK